MSLVALAAASCMTSCIENEEDETVTALREQAKEQAQANIDKTKAETELEKAKLAYQELLNKQQELMNAMQALLNDAQSLKNEQLAAEVAKNIEQYKAELASAQLANMKAQVALEQDMKQYAADCALEDYRKICQAYGEVISAQDNLSSAQRNLANWQSTLADYIKGYNGSDDLAYVSSEIVSKENVIASQESSVASLKAFYAELKSQSLNQSSAAKKRGEVREEINSIVAKIAENDLAQKVNSAELGVKKNKLYEEYNTLCSDRDAVRYQKEYEYQSLQEEVYGWMNTTTSYRIVFDNDYYSMMHTLVFGDYDVYRVFTVVDDAIVVNSDYANSFSNCFLLTSTSNSSVSYNYYQWGTSTGWYYYNGRGFDFTVEGWSNNSSVTNPIYWLRQRAVSGRSNYSVGDPEYKAYNSVISQIDAIYSEASDTYSNYQSKLDSKLNDCLKAIYDAQVKVDNKYAEYNAIQDEDNYYESWNLRTYYNQDSYNYSSSSHYGAYDFAAFDATLVNEKVALIKRLQTLYTLESAYSDYSNTAINLDNQLLTIENNIANAEATLARYKAELGELNEKLTAIKDGAYDPENLLAYYQEQIAQWETRVKAYALRVEQAQEAYEAVVAAIKK